MSTWKWPRAGAVLGVSTLASAAGKRHTALNRSRMLRQVHRGDTPCHFGLAQRPQHRRGRRIRLWACCVCLTLKLHLQLSRSDQSYLTHSDTALRPMNWEPPSCRLSFPLPCQSPATVVSASPSLSLSPSVSSSSPCVCALWSPQPHCLAFEGHKSALPWCRFACVIHATEIDCRDNIARASYMSAVSLF